MEKNRSTFDGTAGRLAGPVMAWMNRDMELAAIDELDPSPDGSVLAVGFGPGVGVAAMAQRLPDGIVGGVDPAAAMVQQARRRNRAAIDSGRVTLDRSTAEAIPWPDATFTGAVAVNSMQLWDPLDAAVHELARVLAPSGWFVAITHVWAIERQSALEDWTNNVSEILTRAGFGDVSHRSASFRSGEGLVLRAQKRLRCNRKAP